MSVTFQIRRNEKLIGSWELHEIRVFIASGVIVPTDEVYMEDAKRWIPIIPPFRRKWNLFDWSGDDDEQWYYTHDGYIHGPRLAQEIMLLHKGGYFDDYDLLSQFSQEEWLKIEDWMQVRAVRPKENEASDYVNEAVEQLNQGNTVGASVSGIKAIRKLWGKVNEVSPASSEWLCIAMDPMMPELNEIADFISNSGYEILNTEEVTQGGRGHIAFRFDSAELATSVKTELDHGKVGPRWRLSFVDRQPDEYDEAL